MGANSTSYKKGEGGRQKGAQNKLTRTVRDVVLEVFNNLQQDPKHCLLAFAKENHTEFYKIASRLIPTDLKAELTGANDEPLRFEITMKT